MKPLSEWTTDELRGRFGSPLVDTLMCIHPTADVLDELLRRERERLTAEFRAELAGVVEANRLLGEAVVKGRSCDSRLGLAAEALCESRVAVAVAETIGRCASEAAATTIDMVGFAESDRMEFVVRNMAKLRDAIVTRILGLQ